MSQFFGKYRGKVVNNLDPLELGRVQVSCPAVLGDGRLSWALPSLPYAGPNIGLFLVPPVGANVWVEFEGGDPDSPILGGCFWGAKQNPARPAVAENKVLKTDSITLTLSDLPGAGGLTIEVGPPAAQVPITLSVNGEGVSVELNPGAIKLTASGIELTFGGASIKMDAAKITLNNGALEVM